tara:strand:+ start:89 stop:952 length:864 start_codon:yes stop_codon:yes gene_type:complete
LKSKLVSKAIIPAAGFGTRFLPLTKAQPKEMLPVVNKPTIQWVIEEAVKAGIRDIAIITGEHKKAIENHFKPIKKLESFLEKNGKNSELEEIKSLNSIANLEFIVQEEQRGLGHAILCAENFIGNDSFAVLLGDTICTGDPNCTESLVNKFNKYGDSIFAVESIQPEETKRYGVISGKEISKQIILVDKLVEKPDTTVSQSLLGILGRYIFTPDIFKFLRKSKPGSGGEIQLTDAMQSFALTHNLYSWKFDGKRYDIGTMRDWFKSHIEMSSESEYSLILKEIINEL